MGILEKIFSNMSSNPSNCQKKSYNLPKNTMNGLKRNGAKLDEFIWIQGPQILDQKTPKNAEFRQSSMVEEAS